VLLEPGRVCREGVANVGKLATAVSFVFMGIRILPGTPLFELAKREGVVA